MVTCTTPPILIFGNANVDLVLGEVDGWPAVGTEVQMQRSEKRAGGSAGNSSLALSGLGIPHRFITTIGKDSNGVWLRDAFDENCCEWIEVDDSTSLTVGIVHKGGDRAFFTTPGHLLSADGKTLAERIPQAPTQWSIALISGQYLMPKLCAEAIDLMQALKSRGWKTAIDPGWPIDGWNEETRSYLKEWLSLCDYALLNEDELYGFTDLTSEPAAISHLQSLMKPTACLVIKKGAKGALALQEAIRCKQTPPKVTVIDSVGAGDTFNAALIAALTDGKTLNEALLASVTTAAKVISTYPRCYG